MKSILHGTTRLIYSSAAFLMLLAVSNSAMGQQLLEPHETCGNDSNAIIAFADPVLGSIVREALSIGSDAALSCGVAAELTALNASGPGPVRAVSGSPEWRDPDHEFHDLSGIQNLTGLTRLSMNNRGLRNIRPLTSLTNLVALNLHTNWISDLSALASMTKLTSLFLSENPLSDISPLSAVSYTHLTLPTKA